MPMSNTEIRPARSAFEERLDFLGLDPATITLIQKVAPVIEENLPHVLDDFYSHISAWPQLARLFSGAQHIQTAKQAQIKHWGHVISGTLDEKYEQSVLAIGEAHSRAGLEPRWYIGGYAFITAGLVSVLLERFFLQSRWAKKKNAQTDEFKSTLAAVLRAVFLDMDLAISTYIDTEKIEYESKLDEMTDLFDANVTGFITHLTEATTDLRDTSGNLSRLSHEGMQQSSDLATAAREASNNVNIVATTTQELSNSIQEINAQINRSGAIASEAVKKAANATASITTLQASSEKIGDVISLISDIAQRTNLLALNATIEAARAGEAGKGFAVVASEVKSLADQTAQATAEITQHIGTMHEEIAISALAIQDVGRTINNMEKISSSVAAAMEEQATAMHDIVRSTDNAAESTKSVSSIAALVSAASKAVKDASEQLNQSSNDLAARNDNLRGEVENFLSLLKKA